MYNLVSKTALFKSPDQEYPLQKKLFSAEHKYTPLCRSRAHLVLFTIGMHRTNDTPLIILRKKSLKKVLFVKKNKNHFGIVISHQEVTCLIRN